jgi:hypothetical protein
MRLIGFLPDVDDHTEGVITDCAMIEPTMRGFAGAPSLVTPSGVTALASGCRGASLNLQLDGTGRLFAGTATKLYESTSWTDVTRAVGGNYTGSTDTRWSFAQFGNVALASNKSDEMQKSIGSGAFSNLAGAPRAKFIDTVAGFVMAINYNDGTDTPDGWYCSAFQDYSDWTPDIGTQCANGRLFDTPGELTGGKSLGGNMIAYKLDAIYVGQYVGAPFIWDWQLVSGEIGAVSQEAIIDIGNYHIFLGRNDIWQFDGTRPSSIAEGIHNWFFEEQLNPAYAYKTIGAHDKSKSLVYFYYVSKAASEIDSCIVYNYKSGKWTRANRSIQAALEYRVGGFTYAGFSSAYPTYADIPAISYGSPFWNATSPVVGVFNTSNQLQTLTGVSVTSSITGGWFGDDLASMTIQRVTPKFIKAPTTCTITNYYRNESGTPQQTGNTTTMNRGRVGVHRRAKWHKIKMDYTGDHEIPDVSIQAKRAGVESL